MPLLFAATLFLNALLLFWVQPLFGKMVLPLLGGSPSVWTTCMLFFQATLLAGYAYSHVGIRLLGVRKQALVHGLLVWLPLLFLPIDVRDAGAPPADGQPVAWLLQTMGSSVGLPFIMLATTAPLLQRWFWSVGERPAADPYRLYAASNAGSLMALLVFPTVFEPLIPIGSQQAIWKGGYAIAATLLTACAIVVYRGASTADVSPSQQAQASGMVEPSPSAGERLRWLALSFAPSSLMLGVTTYLSTDVAAVPLLWVLPLAFYLLTFIVAFGWYSEATHGMALRALPLVLLPLVVLLISEAPAPLWVSVPMHLAAFGGLSLLCHGELAKGRPSVQHLTEFYLWLAAGGALGGVFNTLIAPQVFTSVAEYPCAIAAGCLVCASSGQFRAVLTRPRTLLRPALAAGLAIAAIAAGRLGDVTRPSMMAFLCAPAIVCFSVGRDAARFALGIVGLLSALALATALVPARVVHAERTFFGVYRVTTDAGQHLVSLAHGTTNHGSQVIGAANPEPLTYYHRQGPVGQVFGERGNRSQSVGIIGLGVGTLAAYARPGSAWVFYEIDPAVERIARDATFFRYLERCGGQCAVALGDARLSLARSTAVHDILVLDAFSSDAIPLHLLTTEALQVYESRLAPDGVLVFHISNRHIRLRPVLARLARDRGLTAIARFDPSLDVQRGIAPSDWVVMARRPEELNGLSPDTPWTRLVADDRVAWSDAFSNIWTALR